MRGVATAWTSCCSMDNVQSALIEMLLFTLIKIQPLNHRITNAGPLWLNLDACCKCCTAPNRQLAHCINSWS